MMQPGPFTETLFFYDLCIPAEERQRFVRGPMSIMFLRAGDGCDVHDLGIPSDDPAMLVTVREPLLWQGFTYQAFCTYEAPETPPEAPRFFFVSQQSANFQSSGGLQLIAWRRRVYSEKSPLYVEARWHPRHGESIDLKGMRDDPGLKGVVEARRAVKLLQAVEKRGRRSGPAGFRDLQEFEKELVNLIQKVHANGMDPTQDRVATMLQPLLEHRRRDTGSAASVEVDLNSTKRLIRKHIPYLWQDLVKKALQST
jgi:hypothetical protein